MFWQCCAIYNKGKECSEKQPLEIYNVDRWVDYTLSIYDIPYKQLAPRLSIGQESGDGMGALSVWYTFLNDYTRRLLTFCNDRFPALSGFAKQFSERTGYHYKAGIWLEDFRRGLLWTACSAKLNFEHAPSWSWAVIEGTNDPHFEVPYQQLEFDRHLDCADVELVSFSIQNTNNNPFGFVESASLCLRGLCQSLSTSAETRIHIRVPGRDRTGEYKKRYADSNAAVCLYMDLEMHDTAFESLLQRREVLLLQIARFRGLENHVADEEIESTYSLVIEPAKGTQNMYRRIGMARMPENGEEGLGWDMKTVVII